MRTTLGLRARARVTFSTTSAIALAAGLFSATSYAADFSIADPGYVPPPIVEAAARDWTGFHIGLDTGGQFDFTNSNVFSLNEHAFFGSTQELGDAANLGAANWFISGDIGFDYQVHNNFVVGVFANYDWHPSKSTASHSAQEAGPCIGCFPGGGNIDIDNSQQTRSKLVSNTVEYGDAWGVGVRAGVLVNPRTLVYGLGGYGQKKITAESRYHFDYYNGLAYDDGLSAGGWQPGWFVGGGVETALGDSNFTLGVEYRYARYNGFSTDCELPGCTQSFVSGIDPVTAFTGPYEFNESSMEVGPTSSHTVRARLSYWFN